MVGGGGGGGRGAPRVDAPPFATRHNQYVLDVRDWKSLARFREAIGFSHPRKREILENLASRRPHSNLDLISGAGPHLREVRRLMNLSPGRAYGRHKGGGLAVEQGTEAVTRETLLHHLNGLESAYRAGAYNGIGTRLRADVRTKLPERIRFAGYTGVSLAKRLGLPEGRVHDAIDRRNRPPPRTPGPIVQRIAHLLARSDQEDDAGSDT